MTMPRRGPLALILFVLLGASTGLPASAQTDGDRTDDPNPGHFMRHLRSNWDDIHDVIMRFHHDDPGLKGVAFVSMQWRDGALVAASVDSNSTGNAAFGAALVAALKTWRIRGMTGDWAATVPFRTVIHGSDDPAFPERAIFTGRVTDAAGLPVAGARLVLKPADGAGAGPDTTYTNREGIFIRTLIPPGAWGLECCRDGRAPALLDTLNFARGRHVKRSIVLPDR